MGPRLLLGWVARVARRTWTRATSPRLAPAAELSERAFLAKFDLPLVAQPLLAGDIAAATAALLEHFRQRVTPAWPGLPSELRDPCTSTDPLDPPELADAIARNRFKLGAHSPTLTSAGAIDWHTRPGADQEWFWDLHRHEWWAILGLAYARTKDDAYVTAFVDVMLDWVAHNPPPARKAEGSVNWRLMEVGQRLRLSWIPSFGLFQCSPAFTDRARLTMLRSIYDHARFLFHFQSVRNHVLRESVGLAYVATYFPEFREAVRWRAAAFRRLSQALTTQLHRDGFQIEVSTGYQSLVIEEFRWAQSLLRLNGLPQADFKTALQKMYRAMAYVLRPDGTFPQINDGIVYWDRTHLAEAGALLGDDGLTYLGTAGQRGACPPLASIELADAGLYVLRSDWTRQARYLLFDAGPYGGPHGHEDKLSIEVFAYGQAFLVDSGTYTYDAADPLRAYFVGSHGHNTALVDGLSQVRRWRKANLEPKPAPGPHACWVQRPGVDYVSATYAEGYGAFSFVPPENALVVRDVTHTRSILFVRPDYWLIVDEFRAARPHRYQLLFHTAPDIEVRVEPAKRVRLSAVGGAPTLHLIPAEPDKVDLSCQTGATMPAQGLIQGWYSGGWEHKVPAPVVICEHTGSAAVIATLLYPSPAGCDADSVRIAPLPAEANQGLGFEVATASGRDLLWLPRGDPRERFRPAAFRGRVAGVRLDASGAVVRSFT